MQFRTQRFRIKRFQIAQCQTAQSEWTKQRLLLGLFSLAVVVLTVRADSANAANHLFILSGQSNMTGAVRDAFTPTCSAALWKRARSGRDANEVRSWYSFLGRGLRTATRA